MSDSVKSFLGGVAAIAISIGMIVGVIMLLVLGVSGCNNWKRGQKIKDARNAVKITAIQINNQQQKVQIAKQKAQIRYETAIGIKRAQDEIQSTLTPLYVQFEMVDALKSIAASGSNNSVVYIPAGANGIPLVSTLPGPVGIPEGRK